MNKILKYLSNKKIFDLKNWKRGSLHFLELFIHPVKNVAEGYIRIIDCMIYT